MLKSTPPATQSDPASFFIFLASLEISLGGLAIVLGWWFGPDPRQFLPAWNDFLQIGRSLGVGFLATLPLLAGVLLIERLPIRASRRLRMITEKKLGDMMINLTAPELICFGMVAGVGEELLFRGWLQTSLTGPVNEASLMTVNTVIAIVASSLLFGMLHALTPLYFIIATAAGIYLGSLYIYFGDLLVPITTHALYDVILLLMVVHQRRRMRNAALRTSKPTIPNREDPLPK